MYPHDGYHGKKADGPYVNKNQGQIFILFWLSITFKHILKVVMNAHLHRNIAHLY